MGSVIHTGTQLFAFLRDTEKITPKRSALDSNDSLARQTQRLIQSRYSTLERHESPYWVTHASATASDHVGKRLAPCPADLDGDLLLEPPHRDRIADVPMVQMSSQSITVGIQPEISGNYSRTRQSELSATLELKDSFNMQFSGLLSVEGGLNLSFGLDSLLSRGSDGSQFSSKRSGGRKNSLGLNARNALEYSMASDLQRQRAAKAIANAQASQDVTITANAGVITLQFTVTNSGSQAVRLSEPSFAVLSQMRDANGGVRTETVVKDQAISSEHSSDPWLRDQSMSITLGPGESRTIALRLEGQSTAAVMELMERSRATWATLHFGKQTAITDPRLRDEGGVIPGDERDVSRDLVSRVRKRTIPFLFQPPVRGPFGRARTSLIAAVPPGVMQNEGGVQCWTDDVGEAHLGISLAQLFRYHGNIPTTWAQAQPIRNSHGETLVLPHVGPTLSSLSAHVSKETLMALSPEERRQKGRWELQVYHRDYGAVSLTDFSQAQLTPEHTVHLRWVDGQTLLERELSDLITRGRQQTDKLQSQLQVRPGDVVNLQLDRVRFHQPYVEESYAGTFESGAMHLHVFRRQLRGRNFALSQLPKPLREQVRIRYAFVSPSHTHHADIEWLNAKPDADGRLQVQVPYGMQVPANARLVVEAVPLQTSRREGIFSGATRHDSTPFFLMGKTVHEEYPIEFDYNYEVIPSSSNPANA